MSMHVVATFQSICLLGYTAVYGSIGSIQVHLCSINLHDSYIFTTALPDPTLLFILLLQNLFHIKILFIQKNCLSHYLWFDYTHTLEPAQYDQPYQLLVATVLNKNILSISFINNNYFTAFSLNCRYHV